MSDRPTLDKIEAKRVLEVAQRASARDHAEFQANAPFPRGKYPVTLAEVCVQVELQAQMIEALTKRIVAMERLEKQRWERAAKTFGLPTLEEAS